MDKRPQPHVVRTWTVERTRQPIHTPTLNKPPRKPERGGKPGSKAK
jgi:hypothetical protein